MLNFNQYMGLDKDHPYKGWHKRISDFQSAQNCTDTGLLQFGIVSSPNKTFKIQMSWIKRGTDWKGGGFYFFLLFLRC